METPLFKVSAKSSSSIDELAFYNERVEHEWQRPPTGSGKSVYLREALSQYVSSQGTFGWGASASFKSFAWLLGNRADSPHGFRPPCFAGGRDSVLPCRSPVAHLWPRATKREEWLYISRRDGAAVVTLRANGIEGCTPEEFRQVDRSVTGGSLPMASSGPRAYRYGIAWLACVREIMMGSGRKLAAKQSQSHRHAESKPECS